jgi:hypothetical protein
VFRSSAAGSGIVLSNAPETPDWAATAFHAEIKIFA